MTIHAQTHRLISIQSTGGTEVLSIHEEELPTIAPTEVLVKTLATGVNFIETYQRAGIYTMPLPFTPGSEACGEVIAKGSQIQEFKIGDRITTASAQGTYAEHFVVDQAQAVLVPEGISDDVAAAIPLQGMTAHYLVNSTFPVQPEHTVLFHAGAGGVGGIAIQLLKAIGATVITTVSTDEKERIAKAHGADYVLRYDNFAQQTLELTDGKGVDVVYDSVGKDTFDDSLTTLKKRGMAVLFGGASGQVPPFDLQRLNALGGLFVTRPSLAHYLLTREEMQWRMKELFDRVLAKELTITVDQIFSLDDAAAAHAYLEARKTRGKVLLKPSLS
ncbi:MAG: quinone oxidoreductase [Rothia sp. (in: high G+C Gram-positive bacteria)]|nr:quinone oxidoreductase [Rothia sp. (in: high G+C Gram-positive bacteria)]